jgi:hypothetical protein
MTWSSSVHSGPSEFRIEKAKIAGTLLLSNGAAIEGAFFVAGNSAMHAGPERVKDVLNAEAAFFPFEVHGADESSQTVLYNRDHVIHVAIAGNQEAHLDPGYRVATRRAASMLLSSGQRLNGIVIVYRPRGRDRLSDFARAAEQFRYLETAGLTYLVNARHVVELVEESS